MARTKTGSKKGLEAFHVLQAWRADGAPEFITGCEAWNLTGGLVGNMNSASELRLIDAAVKYTVRGGSLRDYYALKAGN